MAGSEESIGDTIYSTSASAEPGASQVTSNVREAFGSGEIQLEQTTATERREQNAQIKIEREASKIKKKSARALLAGLENKDAAFGAFERVCLLIMAEMLRRGDWVHAALFGFGVIVAWFLKVRADQGPLISWVSKPEKLKKKLVDISRTIYHR